MAYVIINTKTLDALCYEPLGEFKSRELWSPTAFNLFCGRRTIYHNLRTWQFLKEAKEYAKQFKDATVAYYDVSMNRITRLKE